MGKPPDERLTNEVAREICQRQGIKAMLTGNIASLGNHYVITLTAVNGRPAMLWPRAGRSREAKKQVLKSLDKAASEPAAKNGRVPGLSAAVRHAARASDHILARGTAGLQPGRDGTPADAMIRGHSSPKARRGTRSEFRHGLGHARRRLQQSGRARRRGSGHQEGLRICATAPASGKSSTFRPTTTTKSHWIEKALRFMPNGARLIPAKRRLRKYRLAYSIGTAEKAVDMASQAHGLNRRIATPDETGRGL